MVWDALIAMAEQPNGLAVLAAIIILTMSTSFVFFPPTNNDQEEEDDDDDTTLKDAYLTYTPYRPKATWSSDLQVLKAMYLGKIVGGQENLQERLNSFYEQQAELYDSYRVRMLHGRPLMLKAIARNIRATTTTVASLKKKKGAKKEGEKEGLVWVDLACGTGYNVESFRKCLDDDKFRAIYLLDLCVPLVQVAQRERADKYNQKKKKKIIHVVHGDATDFDCPGLPAAGTVDIVTISYSLVMIPDWRKAIANAKRLLKPNGKGMIAVCDFTIDAEQQRPIMKSFWKYVFAKDYVFLNEDHLRVLYQEFDVLEAAGAYGPLPYTPFFLQPAYYYFCGRTTTTTKKEKNQSIDRRKSEL